MSLRKVEEAAFLDELQKIALEKRSVDPMTAVAAKIMFANALGRYGMKSRTVRRLASGVVGIGMRAGAAGKTEIARPLRELAAVVLDPSLVAAYEGGFAIGKTLGPRGIKLLTGGSRIAESKLTEALASRGRKIPTLSQEYLDVLKGVKTDPSKLDYLHTPMSQVASDLGTKIRGLTNDGKVRNLLKSWEPEIIFPK